MPEKYLRQPRYSACRSFSKNKEGIKNFKETGYSRYIHQKNLAKASLQQDMTNVE